MIGEEAPHRAVVSILHSSAPYSESAPLGVLPVPYPRYILHDMQPQIISCAGSNTRSFL